MTFSEKVMLYCIIAVVLLVVFCAFYGCTIDIKPIQVKHSGQVTVHHHIVHHVTESKTPSPAQDSTTPITDWIRK